MQSKLLLPARARLSGFFPRVYTPKDLQLSHQDQPRKSLGNRWQRGTRDQPSPQPQLQLGGLPSARPCVGENWQDWLLLPHGHLPAPGTHSRPHARPFPLGVSGEDPNPHSDPVQALFHPEACSPPSKGLFWGPHISGRTGSIPLFSGMSFALHATAAWAVSCSLPAHESPRRAFGLPQRQLLLLGCC